MFRICTNGSEQAAAVTHCDSELSDTFFTFPDTRSLGSEEGCDSFLMPPSCSPCRTGHGPLITRLSTEEVKAAAPKLSSPWEAQLSRWGIKKP